MTLRGAVPVLVLLMRSRAIAEAQWLSPVDGWVPVDVESGNSVELFRGGFTIGQFISCDIGAQQRYISSDWLPLATIILSETGNLNRDNSEEVHLKLSAVFDEGKTGREYIISTNGMDKDMQSVFMEVSDPQERIQIKMFWNDSSSFLFSAEEAGGDPTIKKLQLSDFEPKKFVVAVSGIKGFVRCRTWESNKALQTDKANLSRLLHSQETRQLAFAAELDR